RLRAPARAVDRPGYRRRKSRWLDRPPRHGPGSAGARPTNRSAPTGLPADQPWRCLPSPLRCEIIEFSIADSIVRPEFISKPHPAVLLNPNIIPLSALDHRLFNGTAPNFRKPVGCGLDGLIFEHQICV